MQRCQTGDRDSGGYHAAVIAAPVGPDGHVVTIDIDTDVTTATRAYLDRAGQPHVHVVHGDGRLGYPAAPAARRSVIGGTTGAALPLTNNTSSP